MSDRLPPGSMGLPFIGETLRLFLEGNFVENRFKRHGPIFKTHVFGHPCVFMIGPEAAEFVLSSHADHFNWRDGWPRNFKVLFGTSLLLQDGEEHKRTRRLMMPAFQRSAFDQYFPIMERIVIGHAKRWQERGGGIGFEDFRTLTFDIASQIFLGVAPGEEIETLCEWFTVLVDGWAIFGLKKALSARERIRRHLLEVIEKRRAAPTKDALSLLIHSTDDTGDTLSIDDICAQTMTILLAGHETSTVMLNHVLLELSWNKNVQQLAREEQLELARQGPLSMEQLGAMPYLDQILLEVERLHPPVTTGFRGVVKPFEFNGYHVPAGWKLQYSIALTHRSPEVYTDPDRFDPERFSPERQESKRKPFSLIGFGGGQRLCIGMAFAKFELKIVLAQLLRSSEWDELPRKKAKRFRFSLLERNTFLKQCRLALRPLQATADLPAQLQGHMPVLRSDSERNTEEHSANAERKSLFFREDRGSTPEFANRYDELIFNPLIRAYYGNCQYYNVGYWEQGISQPQEASQHLVDRLLSWFPEFPEKVLDVGCGLGTTTHQVKSRWPTAQVFGINLSEAQIQRCRANASSCQFSVMDATQLMFADNEFDAILCVEAAFHFNTRKDFIREAYRVLKPGGRLVLTDILQWEGQWTVPPINFVDTLDAYKSIFRDHGFADITLEDATAPCWVAWCHNLRTWLDEQYSAKRIGPDEWQRWSKEVPMLVTAVNHYVLVLASKPLLAT